MRLLSALTLLLVALAAPAAASSSAWFSTEGARLRLVTSGTADSGGLIRGALVIELKPGWKTYWRDPGSSGVPPSIDVSKSANIAAADMAFPTPTRFDDEAGGWVGYKHSVDFPVTFRTASPGQPTEIEADVFLGICQTICVPVQASFLVDPAQDPDNSEHAAILAGALQALPAPAQPDFGVELAASDGERLTVAVRVPPGAETRDFFLAGTEDYLFGPPVRSSTDGRTIFTVPILTAPATKPSGPGLSYTLVSDRGAVGGILPFP